MAVTVNGQALGGTLAWVLARREEDLEDGLQKVGVEVQRNVDQAEGAVLREVNVSEDRGQSMLMHGPL
jgi:hypothetical protein